MSKLLFSAFMVSWFATPTIAATNCLHINLRPYWICEIKTRPFPDYGPFESPRNWVALTCAGDHLLRCVVFRSTRKNLDTLINSVLSQGFRLRDYDGQTNLVFAK